MFFKIKRDKADIQFSLYIRKRDKWRCQRCGRQHEEGSKTLGASHYWGRAHENTRFDPENADAVCNMPCHQIWENDEKEEYRNFKIKHLGMNGFKILQMRANTFCRRDRKFALIKVKFLLE